MKPTLALLLAAALLAPASFAFGQGASGAPANVEPATQGEILPGEIQMPATLAPVGEPGSCVYLVEIDARAGKCRGFIENRCARLVNVAVQHDVAFRRFVTTPIASAGIEAEHHGEPAAGHYEDAGTYRGTMKATLSPGKGRWFERFHKEQGYLVADCKVSFVATWRE